MFWVPWFRFWWLFFPRCWSTCGRSLRSKEFSPCHRAVFFRVRIGWHEPVTIEHRARTKHRAPYLVVAGATEVIDVPCDGSLRAHAYLIGCRRFGGANHPITVALTQHIEDVSPAPGLPRSQD